MYLEVQVKLIETLTASIEELIRSLQHSRFIDVRIIGGFRRFRMVATLTQRYKIV